ncbi:cation diffusion facilitator family transporter [Acidithiobacillus sp. IBUN Pt1247-S3]|uniref:cation diffusion facilitator family transporter n=1 Tax=Acidithiobacillus sp. IBUN Pt1247-S3 TaxID=3166642 RepID=UPI0034E41635
MQHTADLSDHHHQDHHHGHDHHGHDHHGHSHAPANFGRAFAIGICLNFAFVLVEVAFGILGDSLALLADAGHNFADVFGLLLAWGGSRLAQRAPSLRFTYGLRGASILSALGNSVFLLLVTGGIVWEAVLRLLQPAPVAAWDIIIVAAIGVVINTATALLFAAGQKEDLNLRAAFLHMAGDAALSLGVVCTGIAILFTGWLWLDAAVSILVSAFIVWFTWGVLRESVGLALNAVPMGINAVAVRQFLLDQPGVEEVHDLHIWAMSTSENALTAHLLMPDGLHGDDFLHHLAEELSEHFHIHHPTLQVEIGDSEHYCVLAPEGHV